MSANKSVLLLLLCSVKNSLSYKNSEVGLLSSVRYCTKKQPKVLASCVLKQSILSIDGAIKSNATWHINDFLSIKKNADWQYPAELIDDARPQNHNADGESGRNRQSSDATKNIYSRFLSKTADLLRSRTLEFSIPPDDLMQRTGRSFEETGRKKKGGVGHKGGMMFSGFALVAMLAQMFLGKIAFLAAAALMLSKIALMFSAVSALKKQTGGTSGGEHVVYAEQPHSSTSGWQRSFSKPMAYDSTWMNVH